MNALTELEEALSGATSAGVRDKVLHRLAAIEQSLRARVAAGLSRADYIAAQALADACVAARETIDKRT